MSYTGCHRRKGPNFGRVFLMLNYTDITQFLYPKMNGYGDNGKRSLKFWQLLHTYWLPNSYWNWQEYVVSVMLISVLNIKVTCGWHKAIKLNYKNYSHSYLGVLIVTKHCIYRQYWNGILSLWVELVQSKTSQRTFCTQSHDLLGVVASDTL